MPSLVLVAQFAMLFPRDFAWLPASTDLYVATHGGPASIRKLDWVTAIQTPSAAITQSTHIIFDGTDFWADDSAASSDQNVYAYTPALALVATVDTLSPGPTFLTSSGAGVFAANPNGDYISQMHLAGLIANIPNGGAAPVQTSTPLVSALGDIWYVNANAGTFHFRNLSGGVDVVLAGVVDGSSGLCFDGTDFWYSDVTHGRLVKISPAGTILGSFAVTGLPGSLFFGGGFIWLVTVTLASLQIWDLTGTLVDSFSLAAFGQPTFVALATGIPFVSVQGGAFSGILQFAFLSPAVGGVFEGTHVGFWGNGHVGGGTK